MKNKTVKNLLFIAAVALILSKSYAKSGCVSSKPADSSESSVISREQTQILINSKFLPWNSSDGGKAYFKAWNGLENGKDFKSFLEECGEKIENEK